MGEIFITWKRPSIAFGTSHLYLVYRESADAAYNTWLVIRSGPFNNETALPNGSGHMQAQFNNQLLWNSLDSLGNESFPDSDARQYLQDRGRLLVSGDSASGVWDQMKLAASDLNLQFSYKAYSTDPISTEPTINSNSFVNSVLHRVGISYEGNEPPGLGTTPGQYNLLGTSGDDLMFVGRQTDTLIGGDGNDTLVGDGQDNALLGSRGDDIFLSSGGNDILFGGERLIAVAGFNTLQSVTGLADGLDIAKYSYSPLSIQPAGIKISFKNKINFFGDYKSFDYFEVEKFAEVEDVLVVSGTDKLYSIEHIIGTAYIDTVAIDDLRPLNELDNITIDGGGGEDILDFTNYSGALKDIKGTLDFYGEFTIGGVVFPRFEIYRGNNGNEKLYDFWNLANLPSNAFEEGSSTSGVTNDQLDPVEPDISDLIDSVLYDGKFDLDTANNTIKILLGYEYNPLGTLDTIHAAGGNDFVAISDSSGEVRGEEGNDLLIARNAQYVPFSQGEPPDTPTVLEQRLKLDGGVGSDFIATLGGTGAVIVGGEGRDFLFNTSDYGQLYGDTIDGRDADKNPLNTLDPVADAGRTNRGVANSDVFWYWPGTFIMDAGEEDILQLFGWPLTGGSNTLTGMIGLDGLAIDWTSWTTFYGYSESNQLIIFNALAYAMNIGPAGLRGQMIVEDFTFGGLADNVWGAPAAGDLGMTFRMQLEADSPNSVNISVFDSLWGYLITKLAATQRLAKLVNWKPVDDPLVLDLDGDGIETVAVHQSGVHFDLDGDYFAEKTGWIGADDGFLVIDKNGNGRIDDITEMFGAPGVSAFEELAELDAVENGGNADGFLTLDDAAFSELQVWRDLDQDGSTDAGELFGLDELDIVSISTTGDGVESITPTGTTLREGASFTRGDGSTGNTYEALFETDATDTIFRGEKGIAEWQRPLVGEPSISNIPDAKGLGSMAGLAIQAASDFALAETVLNATSAMGLDANGLPSLKQLRADATPVFGAWSQSMELTRELVPVLLNKAPGGTSLAKAENDNACHLLNVA